MSELHESHPRRWPIIVVIIATLIVFLPLCRHEFTNWDDGATVHQNPLLNPPTLLTVKHYFTNVAYGLYVPVTYTVWAGIALIARVEPDERSVKLNPWMFHSANVAFHIVSAIFVFLLLRRLVRKDWAACCGALLFALHPVQLEPVAWVSGLKDVLAGCFGLIALWRYVVRAQDHDADSCSPAARGRSTRRERSDYTNAYSDWIPDLIGTVALILAMLSKPSATMVPAIAVAIDWLILNRPLSRALRSTAVWFVLAIPVIVIGRIAQDVTGIQRVPIHLRPVIVGDSLAFYLYKLVWPMNLAPDYGRTPRVVFEHGWHHYTWIAPLLLAIVLFALRKRFRWAIAAAAIFVIAAAPVLGLATFQFQFISGVADHYLYLAMLGPAVALAFVLSRTRAKLVIGAIAMIAIVTLAIRTRLGAPVWKDDYTLFNHNLNVNPRSVISLNNLGNAYTLDAVSRDDYKKGLEYFQKAMSISEEYPTPYENAGRVLAFLGDVEGSIAASERSIVIRSKLPLTLYPNYMEDHNSLGQVLLKFGEYDRAIAHFEALLKIKPEHAEAKKYLAIAREKKRQRAATQPATTQPATTQPATTQVER